MAIRQIITRGFGNGTFLGEIARIITRGYGIETIPETLVKSFTANLVFAETGIAELVFNELSGSADLVFAESGTAELIF